MHFSASPSESPAHKMGIKGLATEIIREIIPIPVVSKQEIIPPQIPGFMPQGQSFKATTQEGEVTTVTMVTGITEITIILLIRFPDTTVEGIVMAISIFPKPVSFTISA